MDVGNCAVLYHFYKRAYTAVITAADKNELGTFTHIAPGPFVTVMKHAFARRFYPASKAADTRMDIPLGADDLIFSLDGNIKILNICNDKLYCDVSLTE